MLFFFFKQKTAYDMRMSDWSSDVCSSDLPPPPLARCAHDPFQRPIDRLGRAAGEEHALGLLVQYRCDLRAGHLHRRIGFAPVTMRRMGIAEAILQIGHHSGSRFGRSEEHTSELQSLMRNSYAVFCLTKKK